jgi:hypothetical protein
MKYFIWMKKGRRFFSLLLLPLLLGHFLTGSLGQAANHQDNTVKLFRVEDLSDPINVKKYFLTVTEGRGHRIMCPNGSLQTGLGYWDPSHVPLYDSMAPEVANTNPEQQPSLVCPGSEDYESFKPRLFVVRKTEGDVYYLWFREKNYDLYIPGCKGLLAGFGLSVDDASVAQSEEDILFFLPPGEVVEDHIFDLNCFNGEPIGLNLSGIYQQGLKEGKEAFNDNPMCEGGLEPATINKYPNNAEANERYNRGYRKGFIDAKGTYILGDFECTSTYTTLFRKKGQDFFTASNPQCPNLPDISDQSFNEYPHQELNTLYNEQFKLGHSNARLDYINSEACLGQIEEVGKQRARERFGSTSKNCHDPIEMPVPDDLFADQPHWKLRFTDAFHQHWREISESWYQEHCSSNAASAGKTAGLEYFNNHRGDYNCSSPDTVPTIPSEDNPYRDRGALAEAWLEGFAQGFGEALAEFKGSATCANQASVRGENDGKRKYQQGNYSCSSWPSASHFPNPYSDATKRSRYQQGFHKGFNAAREKKVMGKSCNKFTIIAPKLGKAGGGVIIGRPRPRPRPLPRRPIGLLVEDTLSTEEMMTSSLSHESGSLPFSTSILRRRDIPLPPIIYRPILNLSPCKNITNLSEWINPVVGQVAQLSKVVPFCMRFDKGIKKVRVYDGSSLVVEISQQKKMIYKVLRRTGRYQLTFKAYNTRGEVKVLTRKYSVNVQPRKDFKLHKKTLGTQYSPQVIALKDRYVVAWRATQSEDPNCKIYYKIIDRYGYTLRSESCLYRTGHSVNFQLANFRDTYFMVLVTNYTQKRLYARLFKADGRGVGSNSWHNVTSGLTGSVGVSQLTHARNKTLILAAGTDNGLKRYWVRWFYPNTSNGTIQSNWYYVKNRSTDYNRIRTVFSINKKRWGVVVSGTKKNNLMVFEGGSVKKQIPLYGSIISSMHGVAINSNRFAIVMEVKTGSGSNIRSKIAMRQYDAHGNSIGGQMTLVNSISKTYVNLHARAHKGNSVEVVFQNRKSSTDVDVNKVRIGTNGQIQRSSHRIHQASSARQSSPKVAGVSSGESIVVWQSNGATNDNGDIIGRLFDQNGSPY